MPDEKKHLIEAALSLDESLIPVAHETAGITLAERQRRREAVDYAIASVGLSGFTIPDDEKIHAQRFINGEIDLEEFVKPQARPKQETGKERTARPANDGE